MSVYEEKITEKTLFEGSLEVADQLKLSLIYMIYNKKISNI